jgi:hypothetical protein
MSALVCISEDLTRTSGDFRFVLQRTQLHRSKQLKQKDRLASLLPEKWIWDRFLFAVRGHRGTRI